MAVTRNRNKLSKETLCDVNTISCNDNNYYLRSKLLFPKNLFVYFHNSQHLQLKNMLLIVTSCN